jgi:hypothetical protein
MLQVRSHDGCDHYHNANVVSGPAPEDFVARIRHAMPATYARRPSLFGLSLMVNGPYHLPGLAAVEGPLPAPVQ